MPQPGRDANPATYRYGMNGHEKETEINGMAGTLLSAEYWMYDSRLARRWNVDPVEIVGFTPYHAFANNPIYFADPSGAVLGGAVDNCGNALSNIDWLGVASNTMNTAQDNLPDPSTHTDKDGKVLRVYDDGDKGVYKHIDAKTGTDIDKKYISTPGTSAGGVKMGETWTSLGFVNFEVYEKTGKIVVGKGAKINFNSNWATEQVLSILIKNPTALEYAIKAGGGNTWDIKAHTPNGTTESFGSLLFGKYSSARDAGNFAAGAVAQMSAIPNGVLDYGFGTYNLSKNKYGKSMLMVISDYEVFKVNPTVGVAVVLYKAKYGESPLSKVGIDAGKSFIK